MKPTARQKKLLRNVADESFCSGVQDDFGRAPFNDHLPSADPMIALKMKNVMPHVDYWVGNSCLEGREYTAVFWLAEIHKHARFSIHVGNQMVDMGEGNFILFDDRIMHSVCSERVWRGLAYQIPVSHEELK